MPSGPSGTDRDFEPLPPSRYSHRVRMRWWVHMYLDDLEQLVEIFRRASKDDVVEMDTEHHSIARVTQLRGRRWDKKLRISASRPGFLPSVTIYARTVFTNGSVSEPEARALWAELDEFLSERSKWPAKLRRALGWRTLTLRYRDERTPLHTWLSPLIGAAVGAAVTELLHRLSGP